MATFRDLLAAAKAEIREVDTETAATEISAGALVLDVREPDEFEHARVPGATLVPLATVPQNIAAFHGEDTTYVICRSGGRSRQACEYLAAQGADVANVSGGLMAWIASGRDVVSGPA